MKILLYGINFAPELTGTGKYTGEMAARLAAGGHEVRVVCAPPYYPQWEIRPPYSAMAWRREHWQGVELWRCPLWVPPQPGGAKRLLHLASFALCSLPVMFRQVLWRPDAVWVVEPALFCAPAALLAARLTGAKAWLHIQDYEVDAAFDLGLLKGPWLKRLVLAAERWLMRRFDVVSTISQQMLERARAKGVAPAALRYFPNWVDLAQYALPSPDRVAAYRHELGIAPGAVVALYSGNMGGKQGLWVLAEVARICAFGAESDQSAAPSNARAATQTEEIVFVFCGDGAGRADLVQRCLGLSNVRFLDLQPVQRLPDLLAMADVHLLPQRADAADLVMPSKLTAMLASARPVVATAHTGTQLATVVQTCGLVVLPEDPPAFATALRTLAADPDMRERLGAAAYLHAQAHMDKVAVLAQFESDLISLVAKPPPAE